MDASSLTKDDIAKLRNIPVYTADGDEIGHVGDAYYDEETGRLQCVGIAADAIGFAKRTIPVQGATLDEGGLHLPYGGETVQAAPDVNVEEDEARYRDLTDYYRGVEGGDALIRAEEELQVGKRSVAAGRVRLRKWVESEPVETNVELRRETARVEREAIDQPVEGAALGEQEIEVPLRAEEPVVEKQTVAKERISVEKGVETERETVRDELRKERIEVEGDQVEER